MSKEEIILSIISIILGGGVVNGIITHILYNNKLKKELKYKGNDVIAKKIEESLEYVRELENSLNEQEIYDVDSVLEKKKDKVNFFGAMGNGEEAYYLSIFNSFETYNEFMDKVRICRKKYEKNLSCRIALNMVFIEKYLYQLSMFMSVHGGEKDIQFWGCIFSCDLIRWRARLDRMVIRETNKYSFKLESHDSNKWIRLRKRELTEQYQDTLLNYLLNGECRKKDRKRMEEMKGYIEEVYLCRISER